MVVCSCRDIKDSEYTTREELRVRVLQDDHVCGTCLDEFLFDGDALASTGADIRPDNQRGD